MKLSPGQNRLISLALATPPKGLSTLIVFCQRRSGLSTALDAIRRRSDVSPGAPRAVRVHAASGWEAACDLSRRTDTRGCTYVTRLARALAVLSDAARRPVSLLLTEIHDMDLRSQSRFFGALDYVAEEEGLAIRAVLLAHPQIRWDSKRALNVEQQKQFLDWLVDRAPLGHAFDFTRDGLKELAASEQPDAARARPSAVA